MTHVTREQEDVALRERLSTLSPRDAALAEAVAICIRAHQGFREARVGLPVGDLRAANHASMLTAGQLAKEIGDLMS